jgi:hypothetical protein
MKIEKKLTDMLFKTQYKEIREIMNRERKLKVCFSLVVE